MHLDSHAKSPSRPCSSLTHQKVPPAILLPSLLSTHRIFSSLQFFADRSPDYFGTVSTGTQTHKLDTLIYLLARVRRNISPSAPRQDGKRKSQAVRDWALSAISVRKSQAVRDWAPVCDFGAPLFRAAGPSVWLFIAPASEHLANEIPQRADVLAQMAVCGRGSMMRKQSSPFLLLYFPFQYPSGVLISRKSISP